MTNNDILRRLRYTLDLSDEAVAKIFDLGGQAATNEEVDLWTQRPRAADEEVPTSHTPHDDGYISREDEQEVELMTDFALATFLNGLIVDRRGKREGPQPVAERELDNNLILRKLRIAFNWKTEDIVALVDRMGKSVSKHEINAFFRKADQRQYRALNDQYLRYILSGVQKQLRP